MTTDPTGLSEVLMDSAQLAIWAVTAGGIVGGIWKGISELKNNTKVREEDLKWRRADRAATELSKLLNSKNIKAVLAVVDVDRQTLVTRNHGPIVIEHSKLHWFFRTIELGGEGSTVKFGQNDPSEDIRNEFDALFEGLEHLEILVESNVIAAKDVVTPLTYWLRKIQVQPALMKYMQVYEFELAKRFVDRVEAIKT